MNVDCMFCVLLRCAKEEFVCQGWDISIPYDYGKCAFYKVFSLFS